MKTLLIMRHAKSSWKDHALSDFDRPLKKRGKFDSPRMGRYIKEMDLIPNQIISSSAKRARQTADLFVEGCGYSGDVEFHRSLYHGSPGDYIEMLKALGSGFSILVIGHNPGLEELLSIFTGLDEWLPTSSIAHVMLEIQNWVEIDYDTKGKLINLWRPRDIKYWNFR